MHTSMTNIYHNAYTHYTGIIRVCKGDVLMISYEPLWRTMKARGATTYTLRFKENEFGEHVNGGTVLRLQKGESVSTNTIDTLCKILDCKVEDIIEYLPD